MIEFDKNGNPQPNGLSDMQIEDFKKIFVDDLSPSETRQNIYDNYQKYVVDFKMEITNEFKNWVNGSFTTTKLNPNDIDIVNLVEHTEEINNKSTLLEKFLTHGGSKDVYLVDGYFIPIYPNTDPRYTLTEYWKQYWLNWFGHDRQHREKAIIQLSF